MAVFSKLYNALRSDFGTHGLDGETELDVRCACCTRKERLLRFSDLQRSNHICMGGQRFMVNIGDRQVAVYTHHAIVKSVQVVSQSSAIVTLIHFYSTPYDLSIRIQETTNLLDLHLYEIYIIRYKHPTHSADAIIQRACDLMEQNKRATYSVLSCNCEHFCNWCCIGSDNSYQVDNARDTLRSILTGVANSGGKVLKVICKVLLLSVEDLSKVTVGALVVVPWGVLAVMAILYLVYTLHSHMKLDAELNIGNICSICCLRKKKDLWMRFMVYCTLQAGGLGLLSLIITAGASGGIVVGALVACTLLSLVCIVSVPKLHKLFGSPFQGRLVRVTNMNNIWIGDVISLDHWKISHDSIISSVKVYPHTRGKRGKVEVIHYSLPTLFGRRTVVEETIQIDLCNHLILGHNYSGYKIHEPEIVVHRAKQRIGETKYGVMSNRSCHFCHWAKVNEDLIYNCELVPEIAPALHFLKEIDPDETISNLPSHSIHVNHNRGRKHATKLVERTWARIRDDIQAGQVIEFKYTGFWHKAVSTNVHFAEQVLTQLSITVVHYGKHRKVCQETFTFNLNYSDIWIYKYHPLYRYGKEDVVRRARARLGEETYSLIRHRSTHLAREIVVKETNAAVAEYDAIKTGDAICMYYWSFLHDAVVTKVIRGDSKANTTGKLRIIHYALDHLLAAPTVKEETIDVNLKKDLVYLKSYDGYVTYPADVVVKRARSRIGEQKFRVHGNSSSDLVHWAKVVQYPVIISKSTSVHSLSGNADEYLLVPKAGAQCEEFQCFRANAWSDLYPGVIVEYLYYFIWHQGILSHVDEKRMRIKVIHYGAKHLFAARTIMEDNMNLDLRHDSIWIYRGHPRKCHKAGVVLAKARGRLGEQRWRMGNMSWEFCKACVLKQSSKEL